MERIVVYGQGGHSKVIQMMIQNLKNQHVSLIADDDSEKVNEVSAIRVIRAKQLVVYQQDFDSIIIAIGTNSIRKKVAEQYKGCPFATVIDVTALVAEDAAIGIGTVVMPHSVIHPSVQVGKQSIINTGAIVEHDCKIDDYSHISPGAVLAGNVQIGKLVHVGANATILPEIVVGDNAIIGAGAVVTKNVTAGSIMVGNPARQMGKEE